VAAVMRPEASGDRPAAGHRHRLPELVNRHVVEQHRIDTERECLLELRERVDLDLDLDEVAGTRLGALDGGADAAGQRNVVVLDQHGIIQPEAMIAAAAGAHRVFLQRAQPRRRLAGTDDLRLGAVHCANERSRRGRDAAEMTEKVQCRPLAGQQAARGTFDGGDDVTRRDHAAVGPFGGKDRRRRNELEDAARDVEASHHARLSGAQHQRRRLAGRSDRVRRDVAGAAEVFEQGGSHDRLIHDRQQRIKRHVWHSQGTGFRIR